MKLRAEFMGFFNKKIIILVVVVGGFSCINSDFCFDNDEAAMVEVHFDSPFPATPYKKVLDTCMHIYGDLEEWLAALAVTNDVSVRLLCAELLVGKLVNLQHLVSRMFKKQPKVIVEDSDYLKFVVQQIETSTQALMNGLAPERNEQAKQILSTIAKSLEKMKPLE